MIPIYSSNGAWVAVYHKGHIFNVDGEWLGFLVGREVFDGAFNRRISVIMLKAFHAWWDK
jgi:hypothetical protein